MNWSTVNQLRELYIRGGLRVAEVRQALDPDGTGGIAVRDLLNAWERERRRRAAEKPLCFEDRMALDK